MTIPSPTPPLAPGDARPGASDTFNAVFGGIILGITVVAYFLGPILRNADPVWLAVGGCVSGFAVLASYNRIVIVHPQPRMLTLAAIVLGLAGAFMLTVQATTAGESDRALTPVCEDLQAEMLQGMQHHWRIEHGGKPSDAHDAYQALGCRAVAPFQRTRKSFDAEWRPIVDRPPAVTGPEPCRNATPPARREPSRNRLRAKVARRPVCPPAAGLSAYAASAAAGSAYSTSADAVAAARRPSASGTIWSR